MLQGEPRWWCYWELDMAKLAEQTKGEVQEDATSARSGQHTRALDAAGGNST